MADFGGTDNVVATQSLTQSAQEKLRQLVARIERLEEEKKSIGDDIKESYAEAKATGFDSKVLRQVIRFLAGDRAFIEPISCCGGHQVGGVGLCRLPAIERI